jgi:hypothetical protein
MIQDPESEEGEIHDFWGQLWLVPNSPPPQRGVRVRAKRGEHLVWIQKELWESKKFNPSVVVQLVIVIPGANPHPS